MNSYSTSKSQVRLARMFKEVLGVKQVQLEVTWKWLKSSKGRLMYVDIFIPKYKLCIEYDGRQHYEYPNRFHESYEEFVDQQERDKLKKELILQHGMLHISWRESDPITLDNVMKVADQLNLPITFEPTEPKKPARRKKIRRK